jgi:hypothetical protein
MSASETDAANEEIKALQARVIDLETKYSYAIEQIHDLGVRCKLNRDNDHPSFKIDPEHVFKVEEALTKIYKGPTSPSRFRLSPEAEAKAGAFITKHNELHRGKYQGAIGGALTFTFTDTSIGQIQNVECYCGDKECINADEVW